MDDITTYKRFENESTDELIYRICKDKEQIGTWQVVANIINELTGDDFGESTYRKKFQAFQKMLDANQSKFVDSDAQLEEIALQNPDELEEKWGKKYASSVASWRNNWPQLSTYFKYPAEIRKLIYTTNSIENFNRQLRKVTKSKTIFPTDDALFKMLYLAMMDATKKWTGKTWDWGLTLDQLCIYFADRITPEDLY